MRTTIFAVAILSVAFAVYAASDEQTLVVCAPGSPGSTDEAQPRMDALATALGSKVGGGGIAAVYEPTDAGGVKRFESASLGIVSLPFFLTHEKELGLHARLEAVQKGRPALEHWTLVAQKGRVPKLDALAGMTIVSSAGFAPDFVRGAIGQVPAGVKITQSVAMLSALRKAAKGEPIAVLLDGAQAASIASLPFGAQLETVATSPAWPMGVVVTVDSRVKNWPAIQSAMLGLGNDKGGTTVLEGLQMERFVPLDEAAIASARKAFARAQ